MEHNFESVLASRPEAWRQLHDLPDDRLVELARDHDRGAVEALMRRHNRRLFRVTRSILRDNIAAEDAVQATYLRAFAGLETYEAKNRFGAWLSRIAFNEALQIRRDPHAGAASLAESTRTAPATGLVETAHARALLEHAIDGLPEHFRIVFVMRVVQGLDVRETAESLDLNLTTVRTRQFRAQRHLREELTRKLREESSDLFEVGEEGADRVVARVLERLPD